MIYVVAVALTRRKQFFLPAKQQPQVSSAGDLKASDSPEPEANLKPMGQWVEKKKCSQTAPSHFTLFKSYHICNNSLTRMYAANAIQAARHPTDCWLISVATNKNSYYWRRGVESGRGALPACCDWQQQQCVCVSCTCMCVCSEDSSLPLVQLWLFGAALLKPPPVCFFTLCPLHPPGSNALDRIWSSQSH